MTGTETTAECWVYGTEDGAGDLPVVTEGTPDDLAALGAVIFGADTFPADAPYLMYSGLNLLVCDLGG